MENKPKMLDKEFILEQMGDEEIYKIVAANFIETFDTSKVDLKNSLMKKDFNQLSLSAHSIKSMFRTFGANECAKFAESLEKRSLVASVSEEELNDLIKKVISNGELLIEEMKEDIKS